MQRMQIRVFLIWLKSVRKSDRLVCEKIKYFQHYLFFLIEFLLSSWSSFCSAKSRCNDCIVRCFETILCDFKSYLYSTLSRNDIDLTSCHTRLYSTFFRNRTIEFASSFLTTVRTVRFFETVLSFSFSRIYRAIKFQK